MIFDVFLNALFPPVCPVCNKRVMSAGALCADCYAKIRFADTAGKPDRAAAVVYDELTKQLILALKYGDKTELAELMAKMMVNAGGKVLNGADVLVPVPVHWKRLFSRKYNQAALLAQSVAKFGGVPADVFVLKRIKATAKQGSAKQRFENVKGAFAVNEKRSVAGKTVVLIDDVITTGATANECARILKANGAKEVRVLTFAKAVEKN